jgi:ribonucleoside-triphosphate reductase
MTLSTDILSDITVHMKYARFLPEEQRRETWEELVTRNMEMHISKFPNYEEEIRSAFEFVYAKKVLPSMRSLQFGGKPVEISPNRIFNCAYLPVDSIDSFSEAMFLLLGGTGVGYSVQNHHVEQLPEIRKPNPKRTRRFLIGDSIEGWADAVKVLLKAYMGLNTSSVIFDFSAIRPMGSPLKTSGGKAPGPGPLRTCLAKIQNMLENIDDGSKLESIQVHDIMCHLADAVLAGGIRRAALISLFSADDTKMLSCKSGNWWELNPQRGRANNSAVLLRHRLKKDFFFNLWEKIQSSGSGEPGIYLTNDKDWGTNPCCEIALRPHQFCNLTEINASEISNQEELDERAKVAAFLGTLQASYTDFHYLREIWQRQTEKDALIGVSMTGIGSNKVGHLDLVQTAAIVRDTNALWAERIGINKAARTTCVKPAGTTSCVLGTSSGIHAWHNAYYIRRLRVGKNEAIYRYLAEHHPELVEDDKFKSAEQAVIGLPQKAPKGAITRQESAFELLERVKQFSTTWVLKGHRTGENTHNVSATISIKDDEWDAVGKWMWENRHCYNGLSVLPFDGGTYVQAPFEDIDKKQYNDMVNNLVSIDLTKVVEEYDDTNLQGEIACAGGSCEI